jgi:hypothetical protein
MERFQELRAQAVRHAEVADHMLAVTYPTLQDPKLLVTILENVYESMLAAADSLLQYELLFKRINLYGDSVDERLRMFRHLAAKHEIDPRFVKAIEQLREIMREHKESPMEFSRSDHFVMYTDDAGVKTLSPDSIKSYIPLAKEFIKEIIKRTLDHEGLFR